MPTTLAPRTWTSNEILNPVRRGQTVVIPKGTIIHTTMGGDKARKVAGRTYTVEVKMASSGWVDTLNHHKEGRGFVVLPTVTWAGEGSYWHDVQVTPEFCEANGLSMPALPQYQEHETYSLDALPSYGPGYDNRWTS